MCTNSHTGVVVTFQILVNGDVIHEGNYGDDSGEVDWADLLECAHEAIRIEPHDSSPVADNTIVMSDDTGKAFRLSILLGGGITPVSWSTLEALLDASQPYTFDLSKIHTTPFHFGFVDNSVYEYVETVIRWNDAVFPTTEFYTQARDAAIQSQQQTTDTVVKDAFQASATAYANCITTFEIAHEDHRKGLDFANAAESAAFNARQVADTSLQTALYCSARFPN